MPVTVAGHPGTHGRPRPAIPPTGDSRAEETQLSRHGRPPIIAAQSPRCPADASPHQSGQRLIWSLIAESRASQAIQSLFKVSAAQLAPQPSSQEVQMQELCARLGGLTGQAEVVRLLGALFLSECVYKHPEPDVLEHLTLFQSILPSHLVPLRRVQCTLDSVPHRYMIGEGRGQLWLCFAGTKHARDLLADADFVQSSLWGQQAHSASGDGGGRGPAAHRGFLARSNAIPILEIYEHTKASGLHLVLCGHSLGGAVAKLCTLRLLNSLLPPEPPPAISCITFACPAVGNRELAKQVESRGWSGYFRNYMLPEDIVPRLLGVSVASKATASAGRPTTEATKDREVNSAADSVPSRISGFPAQRPQAPGNRLPLSAFRRTLRLVPLTSYGIKTTAKPPETDQRSSAADDIRAGDEVKVDSQADGFSGAGEDLVLAAAASEDISDNTTDTAIGSSSVANSRAPGRWQAVRAAWQAAADSFSAAVPAYALFGQHFHLWEQEVTLMAQPPSGEAATATARDAALRTTNLNEIRNGFVHHRMFSYRARVMSVLQSMPDSVSAAPTSSSRVVSDHRLAPRMTPTGAAGMFPVVDSTPTSAQPSLSGAPKRPQDETSSILVTAWGLGLEGCASLRATCDGAAVTSRALPQEPQGSGARGGRKTLHVLVDVPVRAIRAGTPPRVLLKMQSDFICHEIEVQLQQWQAMLVASPDCRGAVTLLQAFRSSSEPMASVSASSVPRPDHLGVPIVDNSLGGVRFLDLTVSDGSLTQWRRRLLHFAAGLHSDREGASFLIPRGLAAVRRYGWSYALETYGLPVFSMGEGLTSALLGGASSTLRQLPHRLSAVAGRLGEKLIFGDVAQPQMLEAGLSWAPGRGMAGVHVVVLLHDALQLAGGSIQDNHLLRDTVSAAHRAGLPVIVAILGWNDLNTASKKGAVGLLCDYYGFESLRSSQVIGLGQWTSSSVHPGPAKMTSATDYGLEFSADDIRRLRAKVQDVLAKLQRSHRLR